MDAACTELPARCVIDGEIVIATEGGLDFGALQLRLHPAASRVTKLAAETPAAFIAFDLLALGDQDWTGRPFSERRAALVAALAGCARPSTSRRRQQRIPTPRSAGFPSSRAPLWTG